MTQPKVRVDEIGILHVEYASRERLTVDDIRDAYRLHLQLSPMKHPVLSKARAAGKVDMEVQRYVSSPEICAVCSANAIIVHSSWQMHLGRMFLYYFKPPYPTRLFTSESDAIEWLSQFLPPQPFPAGSAAAQAASAIAASGSHANRNQEEQAH